MVTAPATFSLVDSRIPEGPSQTENFWDIDTPDNELVAMIDKKIMSASPEFSKFREEGKRNERYWEGNQLQGLNLRWHNSRIVQNRIYMSAETMVPIITSKPAEPIISVHGEDKESESTRQFIRSIERILMDKYNDDSFSQQEMFEIISRHLLLYKLGVPKIVWNEELDDFYVEFVHPHKLIISANGYYNEDVWVAQYMEETLDNLVKMFPDQETSIMANVFPGMSVDMNLVGSTPIGFWEYWPEDGRYVVWKMQSVILQKKLNPYVKWKEDKTFDIENNHFDYARKPFMFLNSQNLGRHIWDDTSPISQGIPLQDGINMLQRIITDTAKDQGILVGASEYIDRDELYKYTGAPNEKLSVSGADASRALHRVQPKPLADYVQGNLQHLENASDNVIGTHATTRGEKSRNQTLGQDLMAKDSDYGRIDAVVRGSERVAAEMYNWELQMMLVKYKEEHFKRYLGDKEGAKAYSAMKENNKKGIKIVVKPGSTLPTDKVSQRAEAIELAKARKISDIDFFERMDFPNPKEMASNLYLQEHAPEILYPEAVKKIEDAKKKLAADAAKTGPETPPVVPPAAVPPVVPPATPPAVPPMPPMPTAPPVNPPVPPATPPVAPVAPMPPTAPQGGTEHTQALLQGTAVPPFEGIQPSEEHVAAEFQFMGTDKFAQLSKELQVVYAQHAIAERNLIQGGPVSTV